MGSQLCVGRLDTRLAGGIIFNVPQPQRPVDIIPPSVDMQVEQIRAAMAGDEAAFATLYREGYRIVFLRLKAFCQIGKSEAYVEEITSRAWIRAWEKREQFRHNSSFLAWVTQIAKNIHLDESRRRKRFLEIIDWARDLVTDWTHSSNSAVPGTNLEKDERHQRLKAALDKLSDSHREIIELREFMEYSYEEIAEQLNCPIGTVMSRLSSARKKLSHHYEQENL